MAITKINNVLVKHGKIMFGVITAIIIVAFVWFFTPGADGSILFGKNPNSPDAACGDVAGTPITNQDVTNAIDALILFQAMQMNTSPDKLKSNVSFDMAFPLAAMNKSARKFGVVIPDDQVAKFIHTMPAFLKDGKFDKEKYIAYEKNALLPAGYNEKNLQEAVRLLLTADTLPSMLGNTVISPAELEEALRDDLTAINAISISFTLDEFKKNIKPTDKELQAFYDANKGLFLASEKYKGEVVAFRFSDYKVDEKGAKEFYNKNKQIILDDKGKQIPYETFKKDFLKGEQMKLALKDAREFREKVYKATETIAGDKKAYLEAYRKLAAAEKKGKYLKLNKWFSADAKTLPAIGAEPAVAMALAKKAKENAPVTEAVSGTNGVYVAGVTEVLAPAQLSFVQAKDQVKAKYIDQKAAAQLKEAAAKLRADAAKSKKPLNEKAIKALAKNAQVKVEKPVKIADFKKEIQKIRQDMENLSKQNLPEDALQSKAFMAQFQMQSLMMQLQSFMPAMETAAGNLSRETATPNGIVVFYVTGKTLPTAKEIADSKTILKDFQYADKQQIENTAVMDWLGKNVKDYTKMQQQEQKDQAEQKK